MAGKITNYELLTSPTEGGLEAYVIGRMAEGWQPLGAAFFRGDGCLYQTMVKYEEPQPPLNVEYVLDKARLSPPPRPTKL